jgi:ribosomal RNA assembly protein
MPKDRVAILIGPNGATKKTIEERTGASIEVDSKSGDVAVLAKEGTSDFTGLVARDIVKAIARGYSPERAMRLLNEDVYLEFLDIRDYTGKSSKHVRRVRGRLIGTKGKTRRIIEELSGAEVSIYGNTVGMLGDVVELNVAKRAIQMILEGSEHAAVYKFLEGRRRDMKLMEMGMQ